VRVRIGVIYLCMEPMQSKHIAPPVRATEYSEDGINWQTVPDAINAVGSRYALKIKNLHPAEFWLDLANTRVAVGNSTGKIGSKYIAGRVDKACLEAISDPVTSSVATVGARIGLVAELLNPYAVFLR